MKHCNKCDQDKPLEEFPKDSTRKGGRHTTCKICKRSQTNFWASKNPEKKKAAKERWKEKHNGTPEQRAKYRAHYQDNKERILAIRRELFRKNPEARKAVNDQWRRSNMDKARKQRADYRAKTSVAGLTTALHGVKIAEDDQEGTCYWCGTTEADVWHTDHIMPLRLYGCHLEENIVHSCRSCNTSKKEKHPLAWLASLLSE